MLSLNFDPFPRLATERLVLRQLKTGDAREILMLRSDKRVNKFIGRKKATSIDEALQFIRKISDGMAKKECVFWAITLKSKPGLVGTICYWNILEEKHRAEIGYELLPDFQGQGIMLEAIQRVISFGFDEMHLEMITAFPHQHNKKSIKLLKKNKFYINENLDQEMVHDLNSYLVYILPGPSK